MLAGRFILARGCCMEKNDAAFAGAIPDLYDRLLVPLLFEPYAADMAARVAKAHPRDVLEVAAGTGALTRAMADRLGEDTRIIASDLNEPMLARGAARQKDDGRITWQQADAQALPFEDSRFDVVACQFGVMFFPDKLAGYRETLRVLKPGGHYLFNAWEALPRNEFVTVVSDALTMLYPQDPPRFMERTPHGYHEPGTIRRELDAAGFGEIEIERVQRRSRGESAADVAMAYCQGTPLRMEIEARTAPPLEDATKAVADALQHRFGDGPIEGEISAFVVSARRP